MPAEADPVLEEGYGKKNLVSLSNSNGGNVILTWLIELQHFMWDFLHFTFKQKAFKGLSWSFLKVIGAQVSRILLRFHCKSSLVYLRKVKIVVRTIIVGSFAFMGLVDWLDNLSPVLGGMEKSQRE